MVKLIGPLSRLKPIRSLIIGDFILDSYMTGRVERISPEAPVPILNVTREEFLPGMAGNVSLNLVSLGADVAVLGRVGNDEPGSQIISSLKNEGIDVKGLCFQKDYQTIVKRRLIADGQQLIRIDIEKIVSLSPQEERRLTAYYKKILDQVSVVAVSDYAKGFLKPSFLKKLIEAAKEKNIPLIVDPKGSDFSKYRGATMIKPNFQEAYRAANCDFSTPIASVAKKLLAQTEAQMLLITRSQDGMSLFLRSGEQMDFPVKSKEVIDVTGAGDTVLSIITLAIGNQLDLRDTVELANVGAGIAVERLGCVRVSLSDLAERLLDLNPMNKIFNESHLFVMEQILKGKEFIILGLDEGQEMNTALFLSLKSLREKVQKGKLILYINSKTPDPTMISLLSSLTEVDFIILKSESLFHLCEILCPIDVFTLKNKKLVSLEHPKNLITHLAQNI